MMEFRDSLGRLACTGDPETGLVECKYKRQTSSAVLQIGESFTVERDGVITIITRNSAGRFTVERQEKKE